MQVKFGKVLKLAVKIELKSTYDYINVDNNILV